MTTMREVVEDAMEEIGVKTAEVELTDDEMQSGIRRCNDLATQWSDSGIVTGYQPVLDADEAIQIDRNAVRALKKNLAIDLAPSFQKLVTVTLKDLAESSLNALMASSTDLSNIAYPDSLPMGSGNRCQDDTYRRFFPTNKPKNF